MGSDRGYYCIHILLCQLHIKASSRPHRPRGAPSTRKGQSKLFWVRHQSSQIRKMYSMYSQWPKQSLGFVVNPVSRSVQTRYVRRIERLSKPGHENRDRQYIDQRSLSHNSLNYPLRLPQLALDLFLTVSNTTCQQNKRSSLTYSPVSAPVN